MTYEKLIHRWRSAKIWQIYLVTHSNTYTFIKYTMHRWIFWKMLVGGGIWVVGNFDPHSANLDTVYGLPHKRIFSKKCTFCHLDNLFPKTCKSWIFSLKSENLDNWKWKNGETFSLTLEKIIFCWQNIRLWHYDSDDLYQMHVENFILFVS